jgi:hypothetical protein
VFLDTKSVGFWWWCIVIANLKFFDFIHCHVFFDSLINTWQWIKSKNSIILFVSTEFILIQPAHVGLLLGFHVFFHLKNSVVISKQPMHGICPRHLVHRRKCILGTATNTKFPHSSVSHSETLVWHIFRNTLVFTLTDD